MFCEKEASDFVRIPLYFNYCNGQRVKDFCSKSAGEGQVVAWRTLSRCVFFFALLSGHLVTLDAM